MTDNPINPKPKFQNPNEIPISNFGNHEVIFKAIVKLLITAVV